MPECKTVMCYFKSLLIAYVATVVLLITFAWVSYNFRLADSTISLIITAVYLFVNALSGIYIGHTTTKRHMLKGATSGLLYAILLIVTSIIYTKGNVCIVPDAICTTMLCIAGGTFGGMLH